MTDLDYQLIAAEVTNDPASLGYAGKTPDQQSALLVTTSITKQGPISMAEVVIWAALTGVRAKLQGHATNNADALQSAALAVLDAFQGGLPHLDVTNAHVDAMVTAFETAGDFTSDQKTALYSLGQYPEYRWQTIGLSEPPQPGAIMIAMGE